jgi:predicted nuclease with RNAse H fold
VPETVAGVDVSERRGLDVVVLACDRTLARPPLRAVTPEDLGRLLAEEAPAVVAIDSPPAWGIEGSSRYCERELAALGIPCFRTPSDPAACARPFYNWMRTGHAAFAAARAAGYPLYRGEATGRGHALEVFPHACAVAISGRRPPPGTSRRAGAKRRWRTAVLEAEGVNTSALPSLDAVDAALAALAALAVAEGSPWFALGHPEDGFLVLPGTRPAVRYPISTGLG